MLTIMIFVNFSIQELIFCKLFRDLIPVIFVSKESEKEKETKNLKKKDQLLQNFQECHLSRNPVFRLTFFPVQ